MHSFLFCVYFCLASVIILMWYTRNIFLIASDIFFINWTVCMGDNLPERVQILDHAHSICITVRENRIICSQIFCDLLLKSAFERILNVMQLILVKIKGNIKWKYLIKKFHHIKYFSQNCRPACTWEHFHADNLIHLRFDPILLPICTVVRRRLLNSVHVPLEFRLYVLFFLSECIPNAEIYSHVGFVY